MGEQSSSCCVSTVLASWFLEYGSVLSAPSAGKYELNRKNCRFFVQLARSSLLGVCKELVAGDAGKSV